MRFLNAVDSVSNWAARLADCLIIAIGAMMVYEVVARYVFRSPSRWTSDVATTLMIWITFISMAYVLRQGSMVRITALVSKAPPLGRKIAEGFSLCVIAAFAILVAWLCLRAMNEGIAIGRRQPTMLQLPNWVAELPIVVGFALLAIQAIAQLLRLPFVPAPEYEHGTDVESIESSESPS